MGRRGSGHDGVREFGRNIPVQAGTEVTLDYDVIGTAVAAATAAAGFSTCAPSRRGGSLLGATDLCRGQPERRYPLHDNSPRLGLGLFRCRQPAALPAGGLHHRRARLDAPSPVLAAPRSSRIFRCARTGDLSAAGGQRLGRGAVDAMSVTNALGSRSPPPYLFTPAPICWPSRSGCRCLRGIGHAGCFRHLPAILRRPDRQSERSIQTSPTRCGNRCAAAAGISVFVRVFTCRQ